jgi:Protein of unknown function (DUF1153)
MALGELARNNVQFMLVPDTQPMKDAGEAGPRDTIAVDRSKADLVLPPADTKRWSSRRKAAVVVATRTGIITREQAYERYLLSEEELAGWEGAFDRDGIPGLLVTRHHHYRPATLISSEKAVPPTRPAAHGPG